MRLDQRDLLARLVDARLLVGAFRRRPRRGEIATVPGIVLTALIITSPLAFAENSDYWSTIWQPGASLAKDDTTNTNMTKRSKKHTASYKHKHHAKAMNSKAMKSKAQTTGSGSTSAPGATINKDDMTPKSK